MPINKKVGKKEGNKFGKSSEKVGIIDVKKVGIVGLFSKYKMHYNELFEISNFRLIEQDNTCDNSTSQTERLLG